MKHNHVTKKCKRCGCLTVMGVSGNWLLTDALCNKCTGAERQPDGTVWKSWEDTMRFYDPVKEIAFTVTRAEAFHVPS